LSVLVGHTLVVEVNGYKIKPGANLTGANLTGIKLDDTNLRGAVMSDGVIHD